MVDSGHRCANVHYVPVLYDSQLEIVKNTSFMSSSSLQNNHQGVKRPPACPLSANMAIV